MGKTNDPRRSVIVAKERRNDRRNVQDRWIRANKVGGADRVGQVQPVQPMNR